MNGMSYTKPRFSLPAGPEGSPDCKGNHMQPDARGRCLRCGQPLTEKPQHDLDATKTLGRWRPTDTDDVKLSVPVTYRDPRSPNNG